MVSVPTTPDPISAHYGFLPHDRDAKFPASFDVVFTSECIMIILTPYQAPNAYAYAEQWVRSVREECLDHLLIFNARHLDHVLREYGQYHNHARPDQGIGQEIPESANNHPGEGPVQRRDVPLRPHPLLLASYGIKACRT